MRHAPAAFFVSGSLPENLQILLVGKDPVAGGVGGIRPCLAPDNDLFVAVPSFGKMRVNND